MVGSVTAAIDSTVRTPRRSISSTTRSLWTTCPRIAPRPPPAAKRFTLRSAIRTPEQNPYLAARFTIIDRPQRDVSRKDSSLQTPREEPVRLQTCVALEDELPFRISGAERE